MISQSFHEAFALRKLVEEGLDELSAESKALEARLSGKIKAMTEESNQTQSENLNAVEASIETTRKQVERLRRDHSTQLGTLNAELVTQLTNHTKLKTHFESLEAKIKQLGKPPITKPAEQQLPFDPEYFEDRLNQLQA